MGKWKQTIQWGCIVMMTLAVSACSSQPIAQDAPTASATETKTMPVSIATSDGTRVRLTPYETATASTTPTATATSYTGIIPTLASQRPNGTRNAPATVSPTNQPLPQFQNTEYVEHVVQGGESMTIIANQYGVSVDELLTLNGMNRSQVLLVGQIISIPIPLPTATPSPTLDMNDRAAVVLQALIAIEPTALPNTVNNLAYEQFLLMPDTVVEHIREIYAYGQTLGRNPNAFTRIGDSTIEAPHFFYRFDGENYHLGDYTYLQRTIDYYSGSFAHNSMAVIRGLHTWSVFDPMWSPTSCDAGEHMLACEFSLYNPSVIFIRLGTNDRGQADLTRDNFVDIVSYCIDNGVIPILGTKADRFDGESNSVNTVIREVAAQYAIPLWDFDLVASTLPNHGLTGDNVHLSVFYDHDWRLARAFTTGHGLHNLTGLIVLDEIWQVLNDD